MKSVTSINDGHSCVPRHVKLLFEVEVESVQVVNMKGKTKRFQQTKGRRSNWKKAYVKLSDGAAIEELFGSE